MSWSEHHKGNKGFCFVNHRKLAVPVATAEYDHSVMVATLA
jgi:hypothetical protein